MSNRTTAYALKVKNQIAELRKPLSPIERLTNEQLDNLETNYRRANKTTGGRWSLDEVLQEKKRRIADERDPYSVLKVIIQNCRRSADCRTTYAELWRAIRPGQNWNAHPHSSLRAIMSVLERVIYYCIIHDLPILTSLVVKSSDRKLSEKAAENIFQVCCVLRRATLGPNADHFVLRQIAASRDFVVDTK